jgi:hypothetical protein
MLRKEVKKESTLAQPSYKGIKVFTKASPIGTATELNTFNTEALIHAARIVPQRVPALSLGLAIYSAITGDLPPVFESFRPQNKRRKKERTRERF